MPSKRVTHMHTWDALAQIDEHGIPIDHPDTNELFTALADVVATSGLVFVLPGRTPTQAVVMTVEGRDEGHGVGAPEWTSTGTPPLDG